MKKRKAEVLSIVFQLLFLCFMLAFFFGVWHLARNINYSFSYEGMVKKQIENSVKRDCLK